MQYIRAKVVKSLMNNYVPAYIMEGGSITISRGLEVHRGRQGGQTTAPAHTDYLSQGTKPRD